MNRLQNGWLAKAILILLLLGAGTLAYADRPAGDVIVNGTPLGVNQIRFLEQQYRAEVLPGRYWYDPVSGAWGFEGGGTVGQIFPGLGLGGALKADASRGDTGVFINGRELHRQDVLALQRCTAVYQGRYWVNARGIGGVEGGPPMFDLQALCAPKQRSRSSGRTWYNEDGSWSYHNDLTGIRMIGGTQ
jgi:hypothetical protein